MAEGSRRPPLNRTLFVETFWSRRLCYLPRDFHGQRWIERDDRRIYREREKADEEKDAKGRRMARLR